MIEPVPANSAHKPELSLSGSRFYRPAEQTPHSARCSSGRHRDENSLDTLPKIKFSARVLRTPASPSKPRLSPGDDIGVFEHGAQGVTGASLAVVIQENPVANSVKIVSFDGEEKELPLSSVFDPKLMNLVKGGGPPSKAAERALEHARALTKRTSVLAAPVRLPQMQPSPREQVVDITDELVGVEADFCLPSPCGWSARQEENLRHQRLNAPHSNNFNSGISVSAETLSEQLLAMSRPEARAGPPCDAKSFKDALLKKFFRLDQAWDKIDSNGDGSLSFMEFTRACRSIQFVGNLKKIFKELTQGEEVLRPELLDDDLPNKLQRLHKKLGVRKTKNDAAAAKVLTGMAAAAQAAKGGFSHGRRNSSAETLGEVHLMLCRPTAPAGPPCDARSFKNALLKKFGRLELAWDVIDTNSNDLVEFNEFVSACRNIQFVGNLKKIYKELTGGENVLRPELLDASLAADLRKLRSPRKSSPKKETIVNKSDPEFNEEGMRSSSKRRSSSKPTMAEVLDKTSRPEQAASPGSQCDAFKAALLKKFEKLGHAWVKFDLNGDGSLQYHEFVRACRHIHFKSGNFKKLFQELTGGDQSLRPESLDVNLPAELELMKLPQQS